MVQKIFLPYDYVFMEFVLSVQIENQQNNNNCEISTVIDRSNFKERSEKKQQGVPLYPDIIAH